MTIWNTPETQFHETTNDYGMLKILLLILPFLYVLCLWGGCGEEEKLGIHPREPGDKPILLMHEFC